MAFLSPDVFAAAIALTTGEAAAAPSPSTEPDTLLVPEPTLPEGEEETEEAPQKADPPADPEPPKGKFKVKSGDEEKEVDISELTRDYEGRSASTKKFMEAAEIRKEAERTKAEADALIAKVKEREAAVDALLGNPEKVQRYYAFLTGQNIPEAQSSPQLAALAGMDPNMPATLGEVQALLAQAQSSGIKPADIAALKAQLQQEAVKAAQAEHQALETQRAAASIQASLEAAVKAAVVNHPVLAGLEIEELTEKLCDQAQKMDPSSLEEAIAHIHDLATARAEKLNAAFLATRKKAVVEKEKVEQKGIAAPGIAPISNVAPKHAAALGTKEFQAEATAYLQSLMKNR